MADLWRWDSSYVRSHEAPVIVQKYGGTSLGSVAHIKRVCRRIAEAVRYDQPVVVVVSAMGNTTDRLITLGHQVAAEPAARELDMLAATGETIAAPLVALCLQGMGIPAIALTGAQAGIRTNGDHSRAEIIDVQPVRLQRALQEGVVPVVAGFQGVDDEQEITTLGRGGSDTTAVALAAAVGATTCEILTDVDGVFTADPRMVPKARLLPHVAFDEMLELADAGAHVMHPRAVEIGRRYGVPIHVRSSFGRKPGTMIIDRVPWDDSMPIRGIAWKPPADGVSVVSTGAVSDSTLRDRILRTLSAEGIAVDSVTVTGKRIACAVASGDAVHAMRTLHSAFDLDTTDRRSEVGRRRHGTGVEQRAG